MQEQNDNVVATETVRPFARQTARLIAHDELNKLGLEIGVTNYQSVFTFTTIGAEH